MELTMQNGQKKTESSVEWSTKISLFLDAVMDDDALHTRWLNTLSFLEYIGTRKIIKSQNAAEMNLQVLEHMAEEARHALYFKRLGAKYFSSSHLSFREEDLLGETAAEAYFQALDQGVARELEPLPPQLAKSLNYLYVTWLIEQRAMEVYEIYAEKLRARQSPMSLKMILKEESRHLEETTRDLQRLDPQWSIRQKKLLHLEKDLFEKLFENLVQSAGRVQEKEKSKELYV